LCVPHTDGWHAQTDLPIIATTACLANTVHCLQGARFKRRSGATFKRRTHQTWWSAATPQGQVVQACRAAQMAVIEVGAGATPTRCYRTTADWHAGKAVVVGGGH